jgi:DNA-binding response OmpR family regulator
MSAAATLVRRRVLVVDDSEDLGDSMAAALELLGFDACASHDGRDGLALMASWRPEIIFLDLTMPAGGGIEVLQEAKTHAWSQGMVMIAMTGWDAEAQRTRALAAGFDMFVEKPFDLVDLRLLMAPYGTVETTD